MTPEQFTYWLQGFVELTNSDESAVLDAPQWKMIKDHLEAVFHKVTPTYDSFDSFQLNTPQTSPWTTLPSPGGGAIC